MSIRVGRKNILRPYERKCLKCKKIISRRSKPYWVIDLKRAKVKGVVHTMCSYTFKYDEITRAKWWNASPSVDSILFTRKILCAGKSLREQHLSADSPTAEYYCMRSILMDMTYKFASLDEGLRNTAIREKIKDWSKRRVIKSVEKFENNLKIALANEIRLNIKYIGEDLE